ncbi:MAG: hypothetical protein HC896_09295 [Bacteroidales bacterium]|nr:hypothetical protein [Bacteroidales bacterium]
MDGFIAIGSKPCSSKTFIKDFIEHEPKKDDVAWVYYGAALTMQAKCANNPLTKYNYFVKGSKIIDHMAMLYPNHLDVRFVRLLVQYHSPAFLNYKWAIEKDIGFIKRYSPGPSLDKRDAYKKIVHVLTLQNII